MNSGDVKHDIHDAEKRDVESGPKVDVSSSQSIPEPDRRLEKQLLRKLDWRLAPLFAALYFIAYLDRSNIGNAAVAGMTTSLGLTGSQYSTAVSVFFATYVALEIPIVLAMQKIGAHRAIALMCLGWSVVTIGTAFVKSFGELVVVRVLLGVTEAGFFPCLSLYITMVYKKEEQGRRLAYLFSSVALAGMFGGLIATGITYIGDAHGVESWSWLYIIEWCISILVVFWVFFGLPSNPIEAKFLTAEDKNIMVVREAQRAQYLGSLVFEWAEVEKTFLDPKVWLTAFIQFFQDIILYGFSTFLPSILKLDLGYSAIQAQYLSVPVYLLGGICFFAAAVLGDKWRLRGMVLLALDVFAVVGYEILLGMADAPGVRYFACYLIAIPLYCEPGLSEVWINNNMAPHYRRATAIGIQQTVGDIAGIVAPQVYRAAPYRLGHWVSLGSALLAMCLIAVQLGYLYILNQTKSQISKDSNGLFDMQIVFPLQNDTDEQQDIGVTLACLRCRRRKIKCDRKNPCAKCREAGAECDRGAGEKLRPIPKSYVQALESQVASLELLLRAVADADDGQRARMLAEYSSEMTASTLSPKRQSSGKPLADPEIVDGDLARARAKTGQLRRLIKGGAAHFYGGTSFFQISLSGELPPSSNQASASSIDSSDVESQSRHYLLTSVTDSNSSSAGLFFCELRDATAQKLMTAFFEHQYPYNMLIHREYFMRDYDRGEGQYCSDVLICAICAMGALASEDVAERSMVEVYLQHTQNLVQCMLDKPDITLLQALLVLGQCEIGRGRTSRGWLLCGMAFRLTHEMGLHLDPANWVEDSTADSAACTDQDTDREICRRVYWAAFVLDKQLSLFFGRPPALYTYESDVRNPVRLPYPPRWKSLLDSYKIHSSSVGDGIIHVECFIHQAELSKILHRMITELFENRRSNADDAVVLAIVQQINVALNKWLMTLPSRLHWNQWTVGQVPSSVLHLHLLFHTAVIILHRPPRRLWCKPGISTSEDVEVCYASVTAILRLIRSYTKHYKLRFLPLDFAYTLSTTAGVVLMRRHMEGLAWDDTDIARQLGQILETMDEIMEVWPCIREVRDGILQAREKQTASIPQPEMLLHETFFTSSFLPSTGYDWETEKLF